MIKVHEFQPLQSRNHGCIVYSYEVFCLNSQLLNTTVFIFSPKKDSTHFFHSAFRSIYQAFVIEQTAKQYFFSASLWDEKTQLVWREPIHFNF